MKPFEEIGYEAKKNKFFIFVVQIFRIEIDQIQSTRIPKSFPKRPEIRAPLLGHRL